MDDERYIALVDLDAFYASVEELENSNLKGKPLLVGGRPESRGVVAAASYEARKYGCHSAMPMSKAIQLCPEAVILPPRFSLYREYSNQVMDLLKLESSLVQQVSIDEAYIDLSHVCDSMPDAVARAHRMQGRIRINLGLPCSVGLASNKVVAKVACETGKPSGFVIVEPGNESAFLARLDVQRLPGVGPQSTKRLKAHGITTLGDLAGAALGSVMAAVGPWGATLHRRARGQDPSPVSMNRETKSVSAEETFPKDIDTREALAQEIERMTIKIAASLAGQGLVGRTITLKLRRDDFTTLTRSTSNENATAHADAILSDALRLLDIHWVPGEPIRLVGVGISNLRAVQAPGQLRMNALTNQIEE